MKILASLAFAATIALTGVAAGPGGNQPGGPGGNQPGDPGGNQPGGNQPGGSGSLTYDSVIAVTTNANCLVREGKLYGYTSSLAASVEPTSSSIVSSLADGVFAGNTTITAVDLSNTSISELPAGAFSGCTALKRVVLPESCTAIGASAFAGCSALSSVTATGVTAVGADAFRGCRSLASIPPSATSVGECAFADTALTELNLGGVETIGIGAFSCCPGLTAVSSLPSELPAAAFAGCTSLSTSDFSGVAKFGQASLAGIPATTLTLADDAEIADYAFAADKATLETTISSELPDGYEAKFLGREISYTHNGDVIRAEAGELVQWLEENAQSPSVAQPENYATASLESWLGDSANSAAIFAFCYGDGAESTSALTVEGTAFTFTDSSRSAVAVTPVATYDLNEDFSEDKVLREEIADGVYSAIAADPSATACFMRLKFSQNW